MLSFLCRLLLLASCHEYKTASHMVVMGATSSILTWIANLISLGSLRYYKIEFQHHELRQASSGEKLYIFCCFVVFHKKKIGDGKVSYPIDIGFFRFIDRLMYFILE